MAVGGGAGASSGSRNSESSGVVLQLKTNQRGLASAGVIGGQQLERQRRWRGSSTMLDGESQAVGPAGEIEVGIAPGPEVA